MHSPQSTCAQGIQVKLAVSYPHSNRRGDSLHDDYDDDYDDVSDIGRGQ